MMNHGIRPIGKRILVKKVAVEETTTKGGIYLPQTHGVDTHKAEVMAVGTEVTKGVEVGDMILHTVYKGDSVEHDQESFVILDEEDILAVIDRT